MPGHIPAGFFESLFFYFQKKMDRNRDGVVTIEEFIETCQKVNHAIAHKQMNAPKNTSELLISKNTKFSDSVTASCH